MVFDNFITNFSYLLHQFSSGKFQFFKPYKVGCKNLRFSFYNMLRVIWCRGCCRVDSEYPPCKIRHGYYCRPLMLSRNICASMNLWLAFLCSYLVFRLFAGCSYCCSYCCIYSNCLAVGWNLWTSVEGWPQLCWTSILISAIQRWLL